MDFIKVPSLELIDSWATKWNVAKVDHDLINDFGFCAIDGDTPIAAAWLLPLFGSKSSMIRFIISNPDISSDLREEGLKSLISFLSLYSKNLGYPVIFISTNHKKLEDKLQNIGFYKSAENCSHFYGRV